MCGDGSAPLPTALQQGAGGRLDQVTYLGELDSPVSERGWSVERSQDPKVPRRPGFARGSLVCRDTPGKFQLKLFLQRRAMSLVRIVEHQS